MLSSVSASSPSKPLLSPPPSPRPPPTHLSPTTPYTISTSLMKNLLSETPPSREQLRKCKKLFAQVTINSLPVRRKLAPTLSVPAYITSYAGRLVNISRTEIHLMSTHLEKQIPELLETDEFSQKFQTPFDSLIFGK